MSGLGLFLSDNIHIKESSQSLWVFSFLFLIWDYKEDSFPVRARGIGLSCSIEEQSSGFHKEFSSPTCLWVVQLNKHFHRKRQDICLKQEEEKNKNLGLFTFCSPLQQYPVTTVCQSSRKNKPPADLSGCENVLTLLSL